MEIKTTFVSVNVEEELQGACHDAIVELQDKGFVTISTAVVPFHYYDGDDFRAVIAYMRKEKEANETKKAKGKK